MNPINFFGLHIERKTDVLAIAAFVISLLTAIYQVFVFLAHPKAKILMPEAVTLAEFDNSRGQKFVSVIAPISIANVSTAMEPLLVTRQTAHVSVGNRSLMLTWHDSIEIPISERGAKFEQTKALHPFIVETKKISSELVRFTPQRLPCFGRAGCEPNAPFVSLEQFSALLADSLYEQVKFLSVRFTVEFDNHEPVTAVCQVPIMANQLKLLRDVQYFMEHCEPTQ